MSDLPEYIVAHIHLQDPLSRSLLLVAGRAGSKSYAESVGEKDSDLQSGEDIALGADAYDYDSFEAHY